MEVRFESSWILYGAGAFSAFLTLVMFGMADMFRLSPATKSLTYILSSLIFLTCGVYLKDKNISTVSYLLSAASYIIFGFYSSSKLWSSKEAAVLSLGIFSAVFIALGYLIGNERLEIDKKKFLAVTGISVLIGLTMIGLDVSGAQPEYELELKDSVNVTNSEHQEVSIGTLKATNSFWLPRTIEDIEYDVCVRPGKEIRAHIDSDPDFYEVQRLKAGETIDFELEVDISGYHDSNKSIADIYRLEERDECPDDISRNKIIIIEEDEVKRFD